MSGNRDLKIRLADSLDAGFFVTASRIYIARKF